ncbi:hypothetical protein A5651_19005 [Mycobacterium sp. 1274761.0]|nr:hypothetical protein A5651_19005 [Mycobacterium sp. 1274761.0]
MKLASMQRNTGFGGLFRRRRLPKATWWDAPRSGDAEIGVCRAVGTTRGSPIFQRLIPAIVRSVVAVGVGPPWRRIIIDAVA